LLYNPATPGLVFGQLNTDQFAFTNESTQLGTDPSLACTNMGWTWNPGSAFTTEWGNCYPPGVASASPTPVPMAGEDICAAIGGQWMNAQNYCATVNNGIDEY
jgi:hypothetical protein